MKTDIFARQNRGESRKSTRGSIRFDSPTGVAVLELTSLALPETPSFDSANSLSGLRPHRLHLRKPALPFC